MNNKIIKSLISILLLFSIFSNNYAAIVSDSDGSAFVSKKEFEDLKLDFEKQITKYNNSLDEKIDGYIATYLSGLTVASKIIQTSLLNKINNDCDDSYLDGLTEKKYGYRCMAKSYDVPATRKPEGAIVNLFFANAKIKGTNNGETEWGSQWHRLGMTEATRTGLGDVNVPSDSDIKTGRYVMLDKYNNKYYAINRYNDITYRYYATGSGVAGWTDGFPTNFDDQTNKAVAWVFPSFEITETNYWKMELDAAVAYWDVVGQTSYDDMRVFYGPSYDANESINVMPIVGSVNATVYGLLKSNLSKMTLQDSTYTWAGYGNSVMMQTKDNPSNPSSKLSMWWRQNSTPDITFHFNCHPYDSSVKMQELIDYNATVAYADEDKKNVAIYGGLPIFRATGTGEAEVVITFKSHENHNVYAGFSKSQFKNDATYSIDSDLNLRNENDVKYTSNLFNRDKEYTFKMDVNKDDVIWIKTYDASSNTGFTGAKTSSILLIEE